MNKTSELSDFEKWMREREKSCLMVHFKEVWKAALEWAMQEKIRQHPEKVFTELEKLDNEKD